MFIIKVVNRSFENVEILYNNIRRLNYMLEGELWIKKKKRQGI
jgi:hypothetical protein